METDFYVKQTDKHQYLYCMSCHLRKYKESISYAQDMPLRRICSITQAFENRARDLTNFLVAEGYNKVFKQQQIQRERLVTMEGALSPQPQKQRKTVYQ